MQVTQPLSDGERLEFNQCRETVRANIKTCFQVGAALMRIRDGKLYRDHWKTFEAFCEAEFSIKRAHAYRLIDASDVKESVKMSPIGDKISSESHARALTNVPVELRSEVLEAAAAVSGGEPTADAIREAAKAIVPHGTQVPPEPPQPVIELDAIGFAIPEKIVPLWHRQDEVRKLLNAVSLLRTALRKAQEEDDPLYRPSVGKGKGETWATLLTSLDKAYASIGLSIPYAVCPFCQGRLLDTCGNCQGRGFVSEFFYKHAYDSDSRKVREAACARPESK